MKFETFTRKNIEELEDKLCGYICENDKCPQNKEVISCRECLTQVANEIYKYNTINIKID